MTTDPGPYRSLRQSGPRQTKTTPSRRASRSKSPRGPTRLRPAGVPPGGRLEDIASYFNTPGEEIIKANPEIDPWPELLEPGLVIRIPEIEVLIGPGTETFADLTSFYGTTIADFAEINRSRKGLLRPAAPLHLLVPCDAIPPRKTRPRIRTGGFTKLCLLIVACTRQD